jgi:anti-anti-sigma regulatory factor
MRGVASLQNLGAAGTIVADPGRMFRLTESCTSGRLVLKLEGRCSSEVVGEVEAIWQAASRKVGAQAISVDLSDVVLVDDAAREQLARMHRAGAQLLSRGCLMRELVREITRSH